MEKQKGFVLWFTGLPGAGKTTLADKVYKKLDSAGYKVERLDGDIVRRELTKDLDFSREGRRKNIERVAFVSSVLSKHGVGVVASFVSPYKSERDLVKSRVTNYIEIYVSTPLDVCEKRDPKGMYAKARKGEIQNFTGVSDPYEIPEEHHIKACGDREEGIDRIIGEILSYLKENQYIS